MKLKKNIILFMTMLVSASCENFLEEEVVSGVGFGYYKNEQGIVDGVNALYPVLRELFTHNENMLRLTTQGTDLFTQTTEGNKDFHRYDTGLDPENGTIEDLWEHCYRGINLANEIIVRIGDVEFENEEIKKHRLGEAHFMRAFLYFNLVRQLGGVPIKLVPTNSIELEFSRAPVSEVYEQVIADLHAAKNNLLPKDDTDFGRATLGAAQHLLALVYLTRASAETSVRGSQSYDLDSAIYYSEALINNSDYGLEDNYNDLWNYYVENKKDNENSPETIFSIQHTNEESFEEDGNRIQLYWVTQYDVQPGMERDILNGRPYRRNKPTHFYFDLYDRNIDSRLYKSCKFVWVCNNPAKNIPKVNGQPKYDFSVGDTAIIMTLQDNIDATTVDNFTGYYWIPRSTTERSTFDIGFFPQINKFMDPHRLTANQQEGSRDQVLYRLAETYLIAAEAYGRKGDYNKAVELINVIRTRAAYKDGEVKPNHFFLFDGGDITDLTTGTEDEMKIGLDDINSPEKLVNFILDERARELAGEFHRWYDLVRTGKFYERVITHNDVAAARVEEYHKLRPIPQDHINSITNAGPDSQEQNEGYY